MALKNAICHPVDTLPWLPLTKKGGRWQIPLAHIRVCACMYIPININLTPNILKQVPPATFLNFYFDL